MIRRKTRSIEVVHNEDGQAVWFALPHEALLYDTDRGRQAVKDKIDDKRDELALLATCRTDAEQVIFDDADRASVARKIADGKSVV